MSITACCHTISFWEFVNVAATSLAVTNITNLEALFALLDVMGSGELFVEQFALMVAVDLDLPAFRHLVLAILGPERPTLAELDSDGDGAASVVEFVSWPNRRWQCRRAAPCLCSAA